jgi:hypothetical protein
MGIAMALAAGVAPAHARTPTFAAGTGCDEHQAFLEGDEAAVAARLPKGYAPEREPSSGRPLVFVRALRCRDIAIGDRRGPALMASYGIVIESPDGKGCGSAAPGAGGVKGDVPPICNWYTLAWLAKDRRVVDWLRGGSARFPAVHAPGLVFELGEFDGGQGGAPYRFSAPGAFDMNATTRSRPGEISVRVGYWAETPQGTVKLAGSTDDLVSGDATGTVTAAPGSDVAALLGAAQQAYLPAYAAFGAEFIGHGAYRKQVLSTPTNAESFDGSCEFQGDVTFDPPARNEARPGGSAYNARGTCTGKLNGREIADAPVEISQAGRANVSCLRAHTTAPWEGTMRFSDGTVIRYTLDFTTAATEVDGTIYGERSGSAPGHATFLTERTPPDVTVKCGGEGVTSTPMDLAFATDSPLVNEPPSRGARRRMRLAVSPRALHPGERTTFGFRVTAAGRRPVAGAVVRFAGRRVRTGSAGTAQITTTLHRLGLRVARAKKPGFRTARASVRVRRG